VQLSVGTPAGKQAIVGNLGRGALFGGKSILSRPGRQAARSLSQVRMVVLRKSELLRMIQQDQRSTLRFFRSLASRLDR